jgi:hypothetical protein
MDMAMLTVFPLLGAGLLATLLVTRALPPWLLQLSQENGRFAGLESAEPPARPGGGRFFPVAAEFAPAPRPAMPA